MSQSPFPSFETTRLLLRCIEEKDAHMTAALMTEDVSRWLASWQNPYTVELAVTRIKALRTLAFEGDALPFSVIEKATDTLVGWAGIYRDKTDQQRGSLSYWLGTSFQGKGYIRELAPVLMDAGFTLLNLNIIEAAAQLENTASFAVMRVCGMHLEGERMVYASARARHEPCLVYIAERPKL
jgi:ribosomal-protein-alanine N-acetyltransferase